MRVSLGVLVAGPVLAVAGCGGGDSGATGGAGAASIAPKSAVLYATINTDLDSEQVNQLEELLAKFPDREKLLAEIQKSLAEDDLSWETDVKPALGDTFDVVLLDFDNPDDFVGIVKPADEAKLKALLAEGDDPTVSRKIDGWTVVADDEATIDRFETARSSGKLEDADEFNDAMDGLPEEALAKFYVNGGAATDALNEASGGSAGKNRLKAIALALGAQSNGLKLDGAVTSQLDGDFAFWVGRGAPIPEITFLAEANDEAAATAALDKLAGLIPPEAGAQRRSTEVDGVQAKQVVVQGFPITYAVFDGRAIVTTRPGAISDVRDGGDSLADDADFKQAKDDAGMGDETFGFVYLNVEELAALVQGFAGAAGEEIPPEVERNLEPLGSFLLHTGGDPEDLKLSAFLSIE